MMERVGIREKKKERERDIDRERVGRGILERKK